MLPRLRKKGRLYRALKRRCFWKIEFLSTTDRIILLATVITDYPKTPHFPLSPWQHFPEQDYIEFYNVKNPCQKSITKKILFENSI